AVAVAKVHGPRAGIEAVEAIQNASQLNSYYLLYAVLGEFENKLNNFQAAIDNFRKALQLTELSSEQSFLSKRLRDSEEHSLRSVAYNRRDDTSVNREHRVFRDALLSTTGS